MKSLSTRKEFNAVFKKGKIYGGKALALRTLATRRAESRCSFMIQTKVDKKAVVRNLIRRRLREILRIATTRSGFDIVVFVRPAAVDMSFAELREDVELTLKRAHLLTT